MCPSQVRARVEPGNFDVDTMGLGVEETVNLTCILVAVLKPSCEVRHKRTGSPYSDDLHAVQTSAHADCSANPGIPVPEVHGTMWNTACAQRVLYCSYDRDMW